MASTRPSVTKKSANSKAVKMRSIMETALKALATRPMPGSEKQ